jgi:ABC-type histidine transport system ATPase subunit
LDTHTDAAIDVDGIHKSFANVEVLKGVSMTACKGDVISMLGSSGSGKSTFLRCLNLLEIPNAGTVAVNGEVIAMKTGKNGQPEPADMKQVARIRTKLGMVFQSFNLWSHMTIMENVIEAPVHVLKVPKAQAIEQAEAILHKVGMYERRDYYPSHTSGGQQQRAAIARALAMQPDVMLFDEPTSSLDPELIGEVLKVIHDLADDGATMIVVTHEVGFAREVSSHTVFLHEGRIEEEGDPKEIFANPSSDRFRQFLSSNL